MNWMSSNASRFQRPSNRQRGGFSSSSHAATSQHRSRQASRRSRSIRPGRSMDLGMLKTSFVAPPPPPPPSRHVPKQQMQQMQHPQQQHPQQQQQQRRRRRPVTASSQPELQLELSPPRRPRQKLNSSPDVLHVEDIPSVLFFESAHAIPPPSSHITIGKSQSPPTQSPPTMIMGRSKKKRTHTDDNNTLSIPPNPASKRIISLRSGITTHDASSRYFSDFEEVLAQELHDADDWLCLSRPAIEVVMIYSVRSIQATQGSARYITGLSYLDCITDLLDHHSASSTSTKLLRFLASSYNTKDRQLLDILRRLEKIQTHQREDASFENASRVLTFENNEINEKEKELEKVQEEEGEEGEGEGEEQELQGEEEEVATKMIGIGIQTELNIIPSLPLPLPLPLPSMLGVDVGIQSDLQTKVKIAQSKSIACQTEFNSLEEENTRLKNNLRYADLLLQVNISDIKK